MSTYAYNQFIDEVQDKLSGFLTVIDLENTIFAIRDILGSYELDQVITQSSSTDYLLESYLTAIRVEGKAKRR